MNGLLESMTGLSLRHPWMLLLALLVPVALFLRARRGETSVVFPGASLPDASMRATPLPISWRVALLPVPPTLQVIALLAAVVALARPVERTPLPLRTDGIDVVLCLDTSSSMTANDMDRSRTRLDVLRDAAARFIAGRPHDRIALVTFARYPDLRCPLTLDHEALGQVLSEVATVVPDGTEDATGIGTAVARAAQVLRASAAPSKVVVLLTDGEENVALVGATATNSALGEIAPSHAAQLCAALGVRVYAVAAGSGRRAADGTSTALDTTQARRLAERTRGAFFEARDADAMDRVYATIDALEKAPLDEPRFVLEDRFLPFLGACVTLLLLARILGATLLDVLP
ncbi:MAG: VWA domain-containing protein [Planctomycetes bacterium]|nr:VWA domain-containing protein [Planctomycetota bacterium]